MMVVETKNDDPFMDENFDDVSEEKHRNLLKKITSKTSRKIQPSVRNEPSLQVSEFHLSCGQQSTNVKDLADALKKKAPQIRQKIQVAKSTKQALKKPLDKVHADKIKRAVAYENFKKHISRWSAVVAKNKDADQLKFPLRSSEVQVFDNRTIDFTRNSVEPTDLQKSITNLLQSSETASKHQKDLKMSWIEKEKEKYPLTLKELLEKRKTMAKFRAQESYRHAKAHRQNKIKSKKYHRLLRKEKTKEQIKEFEKLQDTDPVAALEKLNEIEKTRAEERASLRHKSTGQWARNHVIRAKYDKESRIALAEQLRKSKDLTQKAGPSLDEEDSGSDSSEDGIEFSEKLIDPNNPWLAERKEFTNFIDGYKQFVQDNEKNCLDKNEQINYELSESDNEMLPEINKETPTKLLSTNKNKITKPNKNIKCKTSNKSKLKTITIEDLDNLNEEESFVEVLKIKDVKIKNNKSLEDVTKLKDNNNLSCYQTEVNNKIHMPEKSCNKIEMIHTPSGTWTVSSEYKKTKQKTHKDVESVLQSVEKALRNEIDKKFNSVSKKLQVTGLEKKKPINEENIQGKSKNYREDEEYLKMHSKRPKTKIDEPLNENIINSSELSTTHIESGKLNINIENKKKENENINPTEFLKVTPVHLDTKELAQIEDCIDDGEKQEKLIAEAFADDDLINEFKEEKKKLEEESKPKNETELPGWGSWAGPNIKKKKNFKRRTNMGMFRTPVKPPRKDFHREKVIIHEKSDDSIKCHMVSELPYPFRDVEEYEETIKLPVGQTWVPETVFRKLTAPPVITEMGQVIDPINEDSVVKLKINN
ncbi:U3 small nucleolar RNA-associated protein 14 homolog A [Adelges cooleyi]|uniref:U3 small nucleolar RNA-associated protein 14 homolog A n=1 Tax=Adelges cooleyi TaxID=133065 RepID=UPI00217F8447|nr:U3 small nucleolar RNA-associated protein 14 homolog A [Adelges cooleyi]